MPPLVNNPEEEAYLFTIILLILKDNMDFLANPGKRKSERERIKSRSNRGFLFQTSKHTSGVQSLRA